MHISEGVLAPSVLISGAAICIVGTAIGLKNINQDDIPKVGVLTAVFFVASLVHVPLGPSSVHLILNGLIGLVLGWAAFPGLLVALFFQSIFFQFGGLTVLGVNTVNMALPGVIAYYLCSGMVHSDNRILNIAGGFIAGAGAVAGAGILVAVSLYMSGQAFLGAAKTILLAHIPVMIIEGLVTVFVISFVKKVRPEILGPG